MEEKFFISKLNGQRTIAMAGTMDNKRKKIIFVFVDHKLKSHKFNQPGLPTEKIEVSFLRANKDGKFTKEFSSACSNPEAAVLTQDQVSDFCDKHEPCFIHGRVVLFIVKQLGTFYVLVVGMAGADGLGIVRYRLDEYYCHDVGQHFIVLPKSVD